MKEAIIDGNLKKVKLYLKAGVPADHAYDESDGSSLLELAASWGHEEIFDHLLEAGADINARTTSGGSILRSACMRRSSIPIIKQLIADSDNEQSDLDEALLHAHDSKNPDVVDLLIEAGASPRFKDAYGYTALLHAVASGQAAIAIRLLAAGADPSARYPSEDYYKMTALEIAQKKGMADVVAACGGPSAPATPTPAFDTLEQCLDAFAVWVSEHVPTLELSAPQTETRLPPDLAESTYIVDIRTLFSKVDGTEDLIIPMRSDDISYALMPLEEAIADRQMMIDQMAEEDTDPAEFWQSSWLPIATNGGGDYLTWNAVNGEILHFDHESRETVQRAGSLLDLFGEIVGGLHSGKYSYDSERGIA